MRRSFYLVLLLALALALAVMIGVCSKSNNIGSRNSSESMVEDPEEDIENKVLNNSGHSRFVKKRKKQKTKITQLKLKVLQSATANGYVTSNEMVQSMTNVEFEESPVNSLAGVESIEIDLPGEGIHTFHKTASDTSDTFFQGEEHQEGGSQGAINMINNNGFFSCSIATNKAVYYLGSNKDGMSLEGVLKDDFPEETQPTMVHHEKPTRLEDISNDNNDISNYIKDISNDDRKRKLRTVADERRLADKRKLQVTQKIDVLVLYTKRAMCQQDSRCDSAAIKARIRLAEKETNSAFQLSGVYIDLNVVGERLTKDIDDTSQKPHAYSRMLDSVRKNQNVAQLRDELHADLVVLIVDNNEGCGIAYKGINPDFGFSVVNRVCMTGYFSFAHEIAHNLGCDHDRKAVFEDEHAFAHAHIDPGRKFRSIMAYSTYCPGCARVQRFSNDKFSYANELIGTPNENNARQLNNMSPSVASYRAEIDKNGCQDIQVNGYPWHDNDGDAFNCWWYSYRNNCATYGHETNIKNSLNANQACCVCGGGRDTTTCTPASSPVSSKFSIQLMNMGTNTVFDEAFQYAKEQWEAIIVGDVEGYRGGNRNNGAPDLLNGVFNTGYYGRVDDLLIGYEIKDLADRSTLGAAGPIYVRKSSGIPLSGSIKLDVVQLNQMTLDDVKIIVIHEMGHVLGIGGVWDNVCGVNCRSNNYAYTCPKAIEEHAKLGTSSSLLLESEGGPGTACNNWDDASFSNEFVSEIMTRNFESEKLQVISRVSAAALEDIGYQVDYCAAADFIVIAADASANTESVDDFLSPSTPLNIVMNQIMPQFLDTNG